MTPTTIPAIAPPDIPVLCCVLELFGTVVGDVALEVDGLESLNGVQCLDQDYANKVWSLEMSSVVAPLLIF